MTLDSFFTMTEIKNGLAAPSRIRELIAVMQNERDCTIRNGADFSRQLSAVANAIAATKNKDCLDMFIQQDGLHFIFKWLKDAKELRDNTCNGYVEDSMIHLLQVLEKLHENYENLVDSELGEIIPDFLVHSSSKVQCKAQMLLDRWKKNRDSGDTSLSVAEKSKLSIDDQAGKSTASAIDTGRPVSSSGDASVSRENSVKEYSLEFAGDKPVLHANSDAVHAIQVDSVDHSVKRFDFLIGDETPLDRVSSSPLPKVTMEHLNSSVGAHLELHDLASPSCINQSPKVGNLPKKSWSDENFRISVDRPFTASFVATDETIPVIDVDLRKNNLTRDRSLHYKSLSNIDLKTIDLDEKCATDNGDASKCRSSTDAVAKEGGNFNCLLLCKSSSAEKRLGSAKDLGTLLSEVDNDGKVRTVGMHVRDNNMASSYKFCRKQEGNEQDRALKKSDVEMDYGFEDPLEFARQVAIEVEREIGDYREQSCSSSEKLPKGIMQKHGSLESVSQKTSPSHEGSPSAGTEDSSVSDGSSSMHQGSETSSKILEDEQINGMQDVATSQVTVSAQETNTQKGPCTFDLNLEICSEDADLHGNEFSVPFFVASASRAAPAPGLMVRPLQFEGNHGWTGTAATSASHPASSHKDPESSKDPSTGRSSNFSKLHQGCLVISDVEKIGSGESSVETNSRSEPIELDLNRATEDGAPSDQLIGQFFPQGSCCQSNSYSSPLIHPRMNIDLNNQPSCPNNANLSKTSQNFGIPGGMKSDDSVIFIMGKRVHVNGKDGSSQDILLPNGKTPELVLDANSGRTGSFFGIGSALPYAQPSVYSYNSIPLGPTTLFSSTINGSGGPIPYMVDSRGTPIYPQIVGSDSALSQPPFLINMNGSTPSHGIVPMQSSFALNSGMMIESASKDPAHFGFLLNSTQVRAADNQLRPYPQPFMNPVAAGKRKQPEYGWELHPFKHCTPWKHHS